MGCRDDPVGRFLWLRFWRWIWMYVFYAFIVLYSGRLFEFPDWAEKRSPYGYIPRLPVEEMADTPVIILILVALALMMAGMFGYNKRDIES